MNILMHKHNIGILEYENLMQRQNISWNSKVTVRISPSGTHTQIPSILDSGEKILEPSPGAFSCSLSPYKKVTYWKLLNACICVLVHVMNALCGRGRKKCDINPFRDKFRLVCLYQTLFQDVKQHNWTVVKF